MSSSNKHLITTAIAYGNAKPHIGHAFEFIIGDTHTRLRETLGEDVYFVTGMDEHGQKIEQAAKQSGEDVQKFVDKNAEAFLDLDKELSINWDFFVRTSDKKKHYKGAQELWKKLVEADAIEKRTYKALYCVGCEEFKAEKDLNEKGECPLHLVKPEVLEEENYFFKLSKYTKEVEEKIKSDELKIYPESRKNEILAFLSRKVEDVSFSRPKTKVSWGIPVPGDEDQVMYVWCDALSNYITALGYGQEEWEEKKEYWDNATHIIGKDILRFHAAIWPAMLIAAGLPIPKRILVHGFITSGGQKMSKTLGNVVDPQELLSLLKTVTDYPGDALRYILLHNIPSYDDGDLTLESIKATYTSLANGIGNLTNRVLRMAIDYEVFCDYQYRLHEEDEKNIKQAINNYDLATLVWILEKNIALLDVYIQTEQPFKTIKVDPERAKSDVKYLLSALARLAILQKSIMPNVSEKILECIRENKMPEKPLFSRL